MSYIIAHVDINFLRWDCQNTVECLASEASFTKHGIILSPGESQSVKGLTHPYDLKVLLYKIGLVPRCTASKTYRLCLRVVGMNTKCYHR